MSKANNIVILGVGRSGTTALYSLIQNIISDDYRYIYEPLLWDIETFNIPFREISDQFQKVSSLSLEGMLEHQKLPLFVTNENEVCSPYIDSWYDDDKPFLAKVIRGNGRLRLFSKHSENTKVVFMIRNPIDVINSGVGMFSFFGDDFHKTDQDRFIDDTRQIYNVDDLRFSTREEKEFAYWYYMNRFFIDSFKGLSIDVLPIVYEDYLSDKSEWLKKICSFLDCEFNPNFVKSSNKKVGPSYSKSNLTREGFDYVYSKMDLYQELISCFSDFSVDIDKIAGKYKSFSKSIDEEYVGCNSLYLRHKMNQQSVVRPMPTKIIKVAREFSNYIKRSK